MTGLKQNAEVVGTDEAFFEDDTVSGILLDLYHEKAGLLDDAGDVEVDLASFAYQIYKNATDADPSLKKRIEEMPARCLLHASAHTPSPISPGGALVYLRTGNGNDALAWVDKNGNSVTESQYAILKAAECRVDTVPVPPQENHHDLIGQAVDLILT